MERYVLGNGIGDYMVFPRGHSPKTTKMLNLAKKYDSKIGAIKMMSTIPNKIKAQGDWRPISMDDLIDSVAQNETIRVVNLNEISEKLEQEFAPVEDMLGNKEVLEKAKKQLELMQEDMLHYIEFNKLSGAEGYKAYKILHEIRLKRREIKDQLETIDFFQTSKITDLLYGGMGNYLSKFKKRKYANRSDITSALFRDSKISMDTVTSICDDIERMV